MKNIKKNKGCGNLKIELENIKNFKDVLINAEYFLDEIKFELDNDGMRFRGLDKSRVAFINMIINSEYFDVFEIEEPCSCIVDTQELLKVLKRAKNDDKLIFSFNDSDLKLQFIKKDVKRNFKIRQVDIEYDSPPVPNIEYPAKFEVNYKQLIDGVKDAELYDMKVKFKTNGNNLSLISDGEFGDYKSNIPLLEDIGRYSSVFSISWLNKIFKINKLSDTIIIHIGNNMPLLLEFEDDNGLEVDFLLAPRIEEE